MNEEFDLLRRELQQRVPLPRIFAHIDSLLLEDSPAEFQRKFIERIARKSGKRIDAALLLKVSRYLFNKFDRIHGGAKYALEDEFVDFFAAAEVSGDYGKCDRFYEVDDGLCIHIRSSESMISEGTTGFALWEASVALLATISAYRHLFEGKKVLELGSGTGLAGLAVAAFANPQSVLLTDVTQVHDTFTHPNLRLNQLENCKVSSQILYWNDMIEDPGDFPVNFNVILGCDLVYDPEVVCILLEALKTLLLAQNSSISTAVLFCTLRNPQTFDDFVDDLLRESKFHVVIEEITETCDNIVLQSLDSFRVVIINKK